MSVRQVLPLIGAAVGGWLTGSAAGAQWGWAIGSAVGNAVDPEVVKGPSIGDIAAQTSQEGTPRPIVFALSQPLAGNIIASGEPRIVRKKESQGKGGPKVETETVYRTYAIGVCEGPITRFVRVWRNGTLVYNVESDTMESDTEFDIMGVNVVVPAQNEAFLQHARFFLGEWDQEPSPDLEALFGVGTTPAHRGTAYMVMADEDLTDMRGAIPQYQFQVERCEGFVVTSRVYPIEAQDALQSVGTVRDAPFALSRDALDSTATVLAGTLGGTLHTYSGLPEAIVSSATVPAGTLRAVLIVYDNYPPERINSTGTLLSGTLRAALVTYDNYPPEALNSTATVLSGTLT